MARQRARRVDAPLRNPRRAVLTVLGYAGFAHEHIGVWRVRWCEVPDGATPWRVAAPRRGWRRLHFGAGKPRARQPGHTAHWLTIHSSLLQHFTCRPNSTAPAPFTKPDLMSMRGV